jgi:hypothetical protein
MLLIYLSHSILILLCNLGGAIVISEVTSERFWVSAWQNEVIEMRHITFCAEKVEAVHWFKTFEAIPY